MSTRSIFALAMVMTLAACSTGAKKPQTMGREFSRPAYSRTEGPDLGAIDGYGIPSQHCGMILYSLSGTTPVPIFRSLDDGTAHMEIEGTIERLILVGRSGETRMNIPSAQFFQADRNTGLKPLTVAISTIWGNSFQSGAFVNDGTITITAADGWSRVVPIAGIAGCRV